MRGCKSRVRDNANNDRNKTYYIYYVVCVFLGILFSIIIGYSNFVAIAITVILASLLILSKSPLNTLFLFILIAPISNTFYLRESIYNIHGFKFIQILAVIIIMISVINYPKSVKIPKNIFYLISAIIIIYTISFFRSLDHLNIFNEFYFIKDKLSPTRYFLSFYVKPIINIMPFIVILKFTKTKKDLESIMNILYLTLIMLSALILYLYVFELKFNTNLDEVSNYYGKYFSMHRNEIASFFIIGFPIVLSKYFNNKKLYNLFIILIVIVAIGLDFSRGGYLSVIIAIFGFLFIYKRKNIIPIFILLIIANIIIMYTPILNRATKGFQTKDRVEISAGRIDYIWLPLVDEYASNPKKLFFGDGRFAICASDSASKGKILQNITHPHNMYLEIILDAGLIGLIFFIAFYYTILKKALQALPFIRDEGLKGYLYANIISILCFLISGITDRSLFPKDDTLFIWIILASTIIITRIATIDMPRNEGIKEIKKI